MDKITSGKTKKKQRELKLHRERLRRQIGWAAKEGGL